MFIVLNGIGLLCIIKDVGTIVRRGNVGNALSERLDSWGWSLELGVVASDFGPPAVRLLLPLILVGGSGGLLDVAPSIAVLVKAKW